MEHNFDLVDFHAHILPGADHGSTSLSITISQLNAAKNAGVTRIIATPHFYPHRTTLEKFLERREHAYRHLLPSLSEDMPEIRLGCEVYLCKNISRMPGIEKLCIYGTKTLLLELPFEPLDSGDVQTVTDLVRAGFDVVLAHVDRYDKRNINMLMNTGARFQINASSLVSFFKKKHLFRWIEEGRVIALGSDIHKEDFKAYSKFNAAKIKIQPHLEYLVKASDDIWNQSTPYDISE